MVRARGAQTGVLTAVMGIRPVCAVELLLGAGDPSAPPRRRRLRLHRPGQEGGAFPVNRHLDEDLPDVLRGVRVPVDGGVFVGTGGSAVREGYLCGLP